MGAIEEAPLLTRHRLRVEEYYRAAEAGVLGADARVELIEGEVIDMAPIGTKHHAAVMRLTELLSSACAGRAIVSVQGPLRLGEHSEPQPDVMLLKPRADYYAEEHPGAGDVLLLIEVADSSVRYDREIKLPLYARHGVQEVWIVDLQARVLRCFADPAGGDYARITVSEAAGAASVAALPGVTIDLAPVLG